MSMSRRRAKRTGRRRGSTRPVRQIAEAARAQFAELGYERATFRAHRRGGRGRPGARRALLRVEGGALPRGDAASARGRRRRSARSPTRRATRLGAASPSSSSARSRTRPRGRSCSGASARPSSHPHAAELVRETVIRDLATLSGSARRRPAGDPCRPDRLSVRRHRARPLRRPRRAARLTTGSGGHRARRPGLSAPPHRAAGRRGSQRRRASGRSRAEQRTPAPRDRQPYVAAAGRVSQIGAATARPRPSSALAGFPRTIVSQPRGSNSTPYSPAAKSA